MIQNSPNSHFFKKIDSLCEEIDAFSFPYSTSDESPDSAFISLQGRVNGLFHRAYQLLQEDCLFVPSPTYFRNMWAGRAQNFQRLSRKLKWLINEIEVVTEGFSLPKESFPFHVLDRLQQKSDTLTENALSQGRLPIDYGDLLEKGKSYVENGLKIKATSRSLESGDKETFHLIANQFSRMDGVKTRKLRGCKGGKGLLIIQSLVKKCFKEDERKSALLKELDRSLQIKWKLDRAMTDPIHQEQMPIYLKKLGKIEPLLADLQNDQKMSYRGWSVEKEPLSSLSVTKSQKGQIQKFLSEVNLTNKALPRPVYLNALAWDIVHDIESLVDGGFILVPLGTKTHCMMAQVECHVKEGIATYTYLLFNTGYGSDLHETVRIQDRLYVKPLKIAGIQKEGLSYSFWEKAISYKISLPTENIEDLYQLHNQHLIQIGKGKRKKNLSLKSSYPVQKFGTCSYNAPEMVVLSHFNQQERDKFEKVKASYAFKKQLKVVKIRRKQFIDAKNLKTRDQLRDHFKQSEALLLFSKDYLKKSKEKSLIKIKK